MKLSVLANLYGAKSLEETLQILTGLGVHTVELGAGGYPGKAHCNPEELLADANKYDEFIALLKETSVAGYVTIVDLTRAGNLIRNNTHDALNPLLLVALIYLTLVVVLTSLLGLLERKLAKSDKS